MGKKRRRIHSPKFINHPLNKWGTDTDTDVLNTPEPAIIIPEPIITETVVTPITAPVKEKVATTPITPKKIKTSTIKPTPTKRSTAKTITRGGTKKTRK